MRVRLSSVLWQWLASCECLSSPLQAWVTSGCVLMLFNEGCRDKRARSVKVLAAHCHCSYKSGTLTYKFIYKRYRS